MVEWWRRRRSSGGVGGDMLICFANRRIIYAPVLAFTRMSGGGDFEEIKHNEVFFPFSGY